MTFPYRVNEALVNLPGPIQKDESMNIVHFLNKDGKKRRMIISRELLPAGADFKSTVQSQINALKDDKVMKVGEVKSMTLSEKNWPATSIDAYAKLGKEHAWQFHVAFHWQEKYLITISLNSEEEMSQAEKVDWLKTIETLEFNT